MGDKYPIVIKSWNNNWENLFTYFDFPPEIRTTFPTEDSIRKALYLPTEQIMAKWTSAKQNWSSTLAQFSILFSDRLEQYV